MKFEAALTQPRAGPELTRSFSALDFSGWPGRSGCLYHGLHGFTRPGKHTRNY